MESKDIILFIIVIIVIYMLYEMNKIKKDNFTTTTPLEMKA
jgi:hypothetical protein